MTPDPRPICVRCNGVVDAMGTNTAGGTRYCRCVCRWPIHGCGQPIYFLLNANENVQPFDYGGVPHHVTCAAFKRWKAEAKKRARPPGVGPLEQFLK